MTRNIVGTGSDGTRDDTVSGRIPRLRFKPERQDAGLRPRGHVDGGWWPRTADLGAELPGLLTVLSARLGPTERVVYDVSGWVSQPTRLPFHGRSIRLDGYPFHRTGTLYVIGVNGSRVVLLVVPPDTAPDHAQVILATAAQPSNESTVADLLAIAQPNETVDRSLQEAQQRWVTDGGTSAGERRWTLSSAGAPAVETGVMS